MLTVHNFRAYVRQEARRRWPEREVTFSRIYSDAELVYYCDVFDIGGQWLGVITRTRRGA